jgi:DNA-binding transcriptional ArsR family regulator
VNSNEIDLDNNDFSIGTAFVGNATFIPPPPAPTQPRKQTRHVIPRLVRVTRVQTCELLCLDLDAAETVRSELDADAAMTLASTLKAFSDPTRLLIVQALAQRELCGCDLGWVTGQSDKVVSHHLGRLRRDRLVTSRREGKVVFASLTERGRVLLGRVQAVAA